MQEVEKKKIKTFKNLYCDAISCAFGEFLDYEKIKEINFSIFTKEQLQTLCDYVVLKNKIAGVSRLNIKVPEFQLGINALERYKLDGYEIISAFQIDNMTSKNLIGRHLMFEIESLLDYSDEFLSNLSDLSAKADIPILIRLGQDLEEVGKIVNKFKMSPVQVLENYGFLDRECYVYGLNFIDKDDQKLLKEYNVNCIISPRDDGENGRGAINMYNLLYNELKVGLASGGLYDIDMLAECRLVKYNTFNLMYENNLINFDDIIDLINDNYYMEIYFDSNSRQETILDKKVVIEHEDYLLLRSKVKDILNKIKVNKNI